LIVPPVVVTPTLSTALRPAAPAIVNVHELLAPPAPWAVTVKLPEDDVCGLIVATVELQLVADTVYGPL